MRFSPLLLLLCVASSHAAELTLEGMFERRTDAYSKRVLGEAVCFIPDAKHAGALPRPAGDERRAWFCFSNRAHAVKAFAIARAGKGCGLRGSATITVSGYALSKGDGESVDTARLERVLAKGAPRPIPCNE